MPVELYKESKEFVWWQVTSPDPTDITAVEVAFILNPNDRPTEPDWTDAVLVDPADPTGDGENWWIRQLVSGTGFGGTVPLAVGDYQAWARLTGTTEKPVRLVGVVSVL